MTVASILLATVLVVGRGRFPRNLFRDGLTADVRLAHTPGDNFGATLASLGIFVWIDAHADRDVTTADHRRLLVFRSSQILLATVALEFFGWGPESIFVLKKAMCNFYCSQHLVAYSTRRRRGSIS